MRGLIFSAIAVYLSISVVQAQHTWDPVWNDGAVTPTNGTWDNITANWTTNNGASNKIWVPGSDAVFGSSVSNYTVAINDSGVTVSNLTLEAGSGKVSFQTITDNFGAITVTPGGATWDTGGRELEIVGNQLNDTRVLMGSSNDTLTVIGGGTFDAGEKQDGANWVLNNATLDIAEAMAVRGNVNNVGQFGTIKLADGTTYIHERNSNQTYGIPDWELGSGVVTFANRFTGNGSITLNGVVSGSGIMQIQCNSTRFVRLNNTNNTFSGKYIVGAANKAGSELLNYSGDAAYGPVPASVEPDYFTLVNGGELKLNGFEIHANRGITLEGSGKIINNTGPTVYGGKITGDGQLIVGRNEGLDGNHLYLTSNTHDYTGGTRIWQGSLTLQIDETLPADGLLTLGGGSKNAHFRMNGFDQTIGGLNLGGGNTRAIWNNDTNTQSTLTIDVADGADYNYGAANIAGSGVINLVKNGLGTQRFGKDGYTTRPASLTVNDGFLAWSSGVGPTGLTTVNSGGTLGGAGTLSTNVVVYSGGSLAPGNPGGQNHLKIQGNLDISDMIDDDAGGLQFSFAAAPGLKDSIVVTNSTGTATNNMDGPSLIGDLDWGDFTFTDVNGVESGTYPLLIADHIAGQLHPTDRSGTVGDLGATGVLSLSNNTIYITIDGADVSPYGKWATDYGLPTGAENEDTDDDGYDNLQEFAYGGDPTNAALIGHAPITGSSDEGGTNWLTLAYGYRSDTNGGVDYTCLTADDLILGTWTNIGITVLGTNTIDGTFDTITNAIPIDGMKDFLGVFLEKQE